MRRYAKYRWVNSFPLRTTKTRNNPITRRGKPFLSSQLRAWRVPVHEEAHPSLKQAGNLRERFV